MAESVRDFRTMFNRFRRERIFSPMMALRRLRPRHLIAIGIAYWVVLVAVQLWRPLWTYWTVTHTPGAHGTASWSYSGSPWARAAWIFLPPLLLTILWIALHDRNPAV